MLGSWTSFPAGGGNNDIPQVLAGCLIVEHQHRGPRSSTQVSWSGLAAILQFSPIPKDFIDMVKLII